MSRDRALTWRPTVDTGSFARYTPYADGREVIVRRGRELGHDYGIPLGARWLSVAGGALQLVRYRQILSPPPLEPGRAVMSPEQAAALAPESEVVRARPIEVLIPREPRGFTEPEVHEIVAAIPELIRDAGSAAPSSREAARDVFAMLDDPSQEVRRCSGCGEAALCCTDTVSYRVRGVSGAGWGVRDYVCRRCDKHVRLVDPKRIRALRLTAWIMIWALLPTPILLLIAHLRQRAWARHPLVGNEA